MKSTAALRYSELRSVAEPQQCQSELCRCTRLLQQSSFKMANTISISHFSFLLPLISQILYEGSLSLSAEAQVFVFLARPR